jgi:hypothetical protein
MGYQPPPMGYPAPQYPQAQPGYPAPPQQYGAPQGYGQPPAPELAAGTLDAFYSQPSVGGGAALKFEVGTTHVGIVTREVTHSDVQQQTNPQNGQPSFFKDGRPKMILKVPLQTQPTADRPDGLAQWYVGPGARDELGRAMRAAGAPDGPPEAGAVIQITCTGTRPAGVGMNPAKTYQVVYQRPQGAPPAPAQEQPQAPAAQAPAPQYQPPAPPQQVQQYQPPAPPQQAPQQAMPPAPPMPQPLAPPVPQQQQQAPAQPPAGPPAGVPQVPAGLPGLDPAQQQLLAGLVGQQLPPAPVAGS